MFFDKEPTKPVETFSFSLSSRQASLLIAGSLLILFFVFITGYFWGKKNAVAQFCMSVEQSSFADRIYTSMCELSDSEPVSAPEVVASNQQSAATTIDAQAESNESDVQDASINTEVVAQNETASVDAPVQHKIAHHAQLVGYGSRQQAEKFVQKLVKKGMAVHLETRNSKSAKGKVRSWYQVVTDDFNNLVELEALVARISKDEKISGVRIVRS